MDKLPVRGAIIEAGEPRILNETIFDGKPLSVGVVSVSAIMLPPLYVEHKAVVGCGGGGRSRPSAAFVVPDTTAVLCFILQRKSKKSCLKVV